MTINIKAGNSQEESPLWISELQVLNLKSFADSGRLQLSKGINVLVGKNNAGKSTLQQAVLCLQTNQQMLFSQTNEIIRVGSPTATIDIYLQDIAAAYFNIEGISSGNQGKLTIQFTSSGKTQTFTPEQEGSLTITNIKSITNQEPNNFIVPYTLKRFGRGFENLTTGNGQAQPTYVFETLPSWQIKFSRLHKLLIAVTHGLMNCVRAL